MYREVNEDEYYALMLDKYLAETDGDYCVNVKTHAVLAELKRYLLDNYREEQFLNRSWNWWEDSILDYAEEKLVDTYLDLDNINQEQAAQFLVNQVMPMVIRYLEDAIEAMFEDECYITDEMWQFAEKEYY